MRRFSDDLTMDEFVDRFIAAHIVPDVDRYGCWEDNVLSWLRTRAGRKDFCLVRYEDFLNDPILELKKVAGILGIERLVQKGWRERLNSVLPRTCAHSRKRRLISGC